MVRVALQLYTLRDADGTLPEVLEGVAEVDAFDGVEFAYRFPDADPDAVADALDRTGLTPVSAHVREETLRGATEGSLDRYERIGCPTAVLSYLDESHFASNEAVTETARIASEFADAVADRGFDFQYHNHAHEFSQVDGESAYELLVERTPEAVGFELDVAWAAIGGADPVGLIERYPDRMGHLHVADTDLSADDPGHVDLGAGDVDLEACVAAARRADVEWLIFEHGHATAPWESVERAADVLEALLE
jgi:sugar phosphate isomerase/epimerase